MSLLTDCALLGVGESANKVASWEADGTLIGTITLPNITNGKKGAIAASITDSRIYVLTGTKNLVIYDADGTLLTTVVLSDTCRALYVPEAGKLWVATNNATNGKILEYDENGAFQSTIADLTYTGGGYIEAGYGFYRYSGFIYYLALRGSGFEINSGVFKDLIADSAVSTQVAALNADSTSQPRRFAMSPDGDFYVTDPDVSGFFREVRRYNSAGVQQANYHVITSGQLAGLATDQDGAFFWTGDIDNSLIYRVSPTTGDKTSFSATADSVICCSVLTTPFGSTPAEDVPLSAFCPTNHEGIVGQSFSSQVNAVGGVSPYTYEVTDGELPPGLELDPDTGIISGTPTTAGTFNYTITVTDNA